jgi:hypothetical protein
MTGHDDHHDHSELSETALRVRALESILTEKGYVDPAALDELVDSYENKIGPRNGARVIARAWKDPAVSRSADGRRYAGDRRTGLCRSARRTYRRSVGTGLAKQVIEVA